MWWVNVHDVLGYVDGVLAWGWEVGPNGGGELVDAAQGGGWTLDGRRCGDCSPWGGMDGVNGMMGRRGWHA